MHDFWMTALAFSLGTFTYHILRGLVVGVYKGIREARAQNEHYLVTVDGNLSREEAQKVADRILKKLGENKNGMQKAT